MGNRAIKPLTGLLTVDTPTVDGVVLRRHELDYEAGALAHLAKRVRVRLSRELTQRGPNWVPDENWVEVWRWYQHATLGLLAEQRHRAKMARGQGRPLLTDEEYAAEISGIVEHAVLTVPDGELEKLLELRARTKGLK